jgi:ankyrin repeat protein
MEKDSISDLDVYRLLRDDKWEEFAALIDNGVLDPNRKITITMLAGDVSFNLLPYAIKPDKNWLLKKMLEKGANPNQKGDPESALEIACGQQNHEAIDLLLNAGAKVNVGRETPLMGAAGHCDLWSVERLLRAGADATKVLSTKKKQSAIWFATSTDYQTKASDRLKIMQLLIAAGCKLQGNEIHYPIYRRDSELVGFLLKEGCSPNEPVVQGEYRDFEKGETPLTLAAVLSTRDMARGILQAKTNQKAKMEILSGLLAAGANPNLPNAKGRTPLFLTVAGYDGEKILTESSGEHSLDMARMLLKAGADPFLKPENCKEGSAADIARAGNHDAFLQLFGVKS